MSARSSVGPKVGATVAMRDEEVFLPVPALMVEVAQHKVAMARRDTKIPVTQLIDITISRYY